jgi:hypothetical protein
MLFVHSLLLIIFAVVGIVLNRGNGAIIIAGYNTSSTERKKKINAKGLAKYVSKIMFLDAFGCVLLIISDIFDSFTMVLIGIAVIIVCSLGGAICEAIKPHLRSNI